MSDFFRTMMGQQFFVGTMPRIAESLKRIADSLERPQFSRRELEVLGRAVDHAMMNFDLRSDIDRLGELNNKIEGLLKKEVP